MKKRIFGALIISTILFAPTANAQIGSGLKGLKEKVLGGGEGSTKEKSETKSEAGSGKEEGGKTKLSAADKDKANTTLDSQEFTKDARGISGIYYSSTPIKAPNKQQTSMKEMSKFLVTYHVDLAKNETYIKIASRYSFETTNISNLVEPLVYTQTGNATYWEKVMNVAGYVNYTSVAYNNYQAQFRDYKVDLQNKIIPTNITYGKISKYIYVVEPGIIVIGSGYGKNTEPDALAYVKTNPLLVLYWPEKEEEAMKYTGEKGLEKIAEIDKKMEDAHIQVEKGSAELPKPIAAFKEEPTNASLMEAVKKRMTEMPYYKNKQLVYVYNVAPWEQKFENIGLLGKTLTYRQMQVIAIFKDGNNCHYARMLMRQNNSYVGGTSQEKWAGNPVYCNGDQQLEPIDCGKANKYKK